MDVLNAVLLWVHLGALALGGAATFGLPAVASQMPKATPEGRGSLVAAMMLLGRLGGIAIGLLILSGLVLIWSHFGGPGAMSPWFWAKIALVAGFIALISVSRRNAAKAIAGDRVAAGRQRYFGLASVVTLLTIVLLAVLALG
jgi:uncharacterized membrane protein SirB2